MAPLPDSSDLKETSIHLSAGVTIVVEASVSSTARQFSVSLETSQHEEVPFRLTACLDRRNLLLHRRKHCIWETLQRFASESFPFSSNETFQLQLRLSRVQSGMLEISVNGCNLTAVRIGRSSSEKVNKLMVVDVPSCGGVRSLSDVTIRVQVCEVPYEGVVHEVQ